MSATIAEVKANPSWADLLIRTDEQSPGVALKDLLADIEEDLRLADVIEACNPKGPM